MTSRLLVLTSLATAGFALGGAYEVRQQMASRGDLTRLQHTIELLQTELVRARRANASSHNPAVAGQMAAAASPFAATGDPIFDAEERELLRRVYALKRWIEQHPAEWIPEIRDADDMDWFAAIRTLSRWDDSQLPFLADHLRHLAQVDFLGSVYHALDRYLGEHDGILPRNVHELIPYFGGTCDEEALGRYRMVASGRSSAVPVGKPVMSEIMSPAEQEAAELSTYNTLRVAIRNRRPSPGESALEQQRSRAIFEAIEAYRRSHNGDRPTQTQQLKPFLSDPAVLEGVTLEDDGFSTAPAQP